METITVPLGLHSRWPGGKTGNSEVETVAFTESGKG